MVSFINIKSKSLRDFKRVINRVYRVACFSIVLLLWIQPHIFAAMTPTTQLLKQIGSGAPTSYGDYISSSGGLNTYYSYYVEVPSGLTRLLIRIFDADVGRGNPGNNDWTNDTYNTSCLYTAYNPSGTSVGTITGSSSSGTNNNWQTLCSVANPAAGHWEVRVDMSSAVTTGNDENSYGIRAYNQAGGFELPIYAASFAPIGVVGTGATLSTTLYPYVTSGCSLAANDWDGDNGAATLCTFQLTSRTGNTTAGYNGSTTTAWLNYPLSGFTRDDLVSDYGIWSVRGTYTDTGANANFGVLYISNYAASSPPPTAQPQSNTFRIYFPTDAGSAPVKPFLSQNLAYVSGPNPPANGSTTRIKIALSIFNPTTRAITFSASNLVRANAPGTRVVYAGNAEVTQGSITGEPGIGGSGNITWNPGSVAGGNNYETLYYQVDVTPSAAGQRNAVTGTPTANGATAAYVDETGNTTQARATCTLGPICELAVTEGTNVPTLAALSSFKSYRQNGRTVVHWETNSEIGTSGFYLLRRDEPGNYYRKVNKNLLPGLLHFPQGGTYRFVDAAARFGGTYRYKLVEIEADGRQNTYGPFKVTVGEPPDDYSLPVWDPAHESYSKEAQPISAEKMARLTARRQELSAGALGNAKAKDQIKIAVKEKGLYYLDAAVIAAAVSGFTYNDVAAMIGNHNLRLSNQGEDAAWLPAAGNTGLYFYGDSIDSLYSDYNIYWLKLGMGMRMNLVNGGSPAPASGAETFNENLHIEKDQYALTALFKNEGDDFWLWDFIRAGESGKDFVFQVDGPASQGTAMLSIHLKGATDTAADPDHHARIYLNGTYLGKCRWDGLGAPTVNFRFNQSLLQDGPNTLTISGLLGNGVPHSIFYLDSIYLIFDRYYRAASESLLCTGDGHPVITVSGFSQPDIRVFDVTQPKQAKLVVGTYIDAANRVSFIPQAPGNRYLVVGGGGISTPAGVYFDKPSSLKKRSNSADYVIITTPELAAAAANLARRQQYKGLETMVVDIEDVYDEFNYGIASPQAIKDFLAYAYRNWLGQGPEYVVLAGEGTYDYKNILGYGDNLIPVMMVATPYGLFASDVRYGDASGNDGIPEIAVGRLPVLTSAELQAYVDKLTDYEAGGGEWTGKILMLADNPDDGGEFPVDSDYLANFLAGYRLEKVYLGDFPNIAKARQKMFESINAGALLVNYIGHAGLDRLAQEGLLKSADVPALQNETRLPLAAFVTCVAGRFSIPGYDSLGEALVLRSNGGAVAAWAPDGASINDMGKHLAEEFFKALFHQPEKIVGKAMIQAVQNYIAGGGKLYISDVYNLLGDPALQIK